MTKNFNVSQRISIVPQYVQAVTGQTIILRSSQLIVNPAADLATLIINIPAYQEGTVVTIRSSKAVAGLTVNTGGYSFIGGSGPTSLAANEAVSFIVSKGKWYAN